MSHRNLHLLQGNLTFAETEPFFLELGGALSPVTCRFSVYGEPNDSCDNVVLICHALSGSARVDEWWPELFGEDRVFGGDTWCVVCTNILGSRYGSTGPTSINRVTGRPFGAAFPTVTIGDMVRVQKKLLEQWGIERLHAVIGGSIGGMQALEWALRYPDAVERCIAFASTPLNSLGLALNHIQRQAIAIEGGLGLRVARQLAMCSYKSPELFAQRHGRNPNRRGGAPLESPLGRFDVAGYLDYQGEAFAERFDPQTYEVITRAMDLWDPEREHGQEVWERIRAHTTLVGISSDWLFPAAEVRFLAETLSRSGVDSGYREIRSSHGHDAFLAEPHHVNSLLNELLSQPIRKHTAACAKLVRLEEHNGTTC